MKFILVLLTAIFTITPIAEAKQVAQQFCYDGPNCLTLTVGDGKVDIQVPMVSADAAQRVEAANKFLIDQGIGGSVKVSFAPYEVFIRQIQSGIVQQEVKRAELRKEMEMTREEERKLDYCLVGVAGCDLAIFAVGATKQWVTVLAAAAACYGMKLVCEEMVDAYDKYRIRFNEKFEEMKIYEQKIKDEQAAAAAEAAVGGGDGGLEPEEVVGGSVTSGVGGRLDCRELPPYRVEISGEIWDFDAEVVCKPNGGW